MNNKTQIASAVRWLGAGRLIAQVISWTITIVVMRILSPQDYGIAAMSATVIALISLVSEFGFGTAIVQAKSITRQQTESVFGASLMFNLTGYAVLFAASPLAGDFFRDERLTTVVQVSGLSLILSALATTPDALLRRDLNFKTIALIDLASTVAGSSLTLLLAFNKFQFWALVWGPIGAASVRTLLLHLNAGTLILPSLKISPAISLIKFGGQVAVARTAGYAVTQCDIIFAGRFLGKEALGIYSVALDLALMPVNKIMSLVNQVSLSALSKTSRERPEECGHAMLTGLRLVSYVIFPFLWALAALAPWLIPALLGPKWLDAVHPLQVICLVLPIRVISNFVSTATVSFGRPDIEVRDKLTSAVVFPVSFFVGVQFGIEGLAYAWIVALPLSTAINLFRTQKAFGVGHGLVGKAVFKATLIGAAMVTVMTLLAHAIADALHVWLIIPIVAITGAVIYCGAVWQWDRQHARLLLSGLRR